MTTTPQSNVVGLFDDHKKADAAVAELRNAGLEAAPLPIPADDAKPVEAAHTAVTVQAEDRHAEVQNVLQRHGAHDIQSVAR